MHSFCFHKEEHILTGWKPTTNWTGSFIGLGFNFFSVYASVHLYEAIIAKRIFNQIINFC